MAGNDNYRKRLEKAFNKADNNCKVAFANTLGLQATQEQELMNKPFKSSGGGQSTKSTDSSSSQTHDPGNYNPELQSKTLVNLFYTDFT